MIEETAPSVAASRAVVAQRFFCPATIVDGVIRLHRSDHVQLRKPRKIFLSHVLRVLDGKALVMVTVLLFDIAEDVEHHGNRAVADGMNAHLQSGGIGLH